MNNQSTDSRFKCSVPTASAAWLYFQREGEAAFNAGTDSGKAYILLNAALSFAEMMGKSDPRITITLDKLSEVTELLGDYETSSEFSNRSISFKFALLGRKNASVLKNYRSLIRLYEKRNMLKEARKISVLVDTIVQTYNPIQIRIAHENDFAERSSQAETIAPGTRLTMVDEKPILAPIAIRKRVTVSLAHLHKSTCA